MRALLIIALTLALTACQKPAQTTTDSAQTTGAPLVDTAAVFSAAKSTPESCAPENPNDCAGFTDLDPEAIRASLNATPLSKREDGDQVMQVGDIQVVFTEASTGWLMSVHAPPPAN